MVIDAQMIDTNTSNNSFFVAKRGKEVKVDTHHQEKLEKDRKKEQIRLAKEKRFNKKKEALINNALEQVKKSEDNINLVSKKASSQELNKARERVLRAVKTPFTYYYYSSKNVSDISVFTNICQCLNDKYADRIYQPQYFAIAEQSDRIFQINNLLISQAIGIALTYPKNKFVVQVSPKYLETKERLEELDLLFSAIPSNLIVCFDARTLVMAGDKGRVNLLSLMNKYHFQIMIDNPETERLSILFDYPFQYLRLDNRYFLDRSENKRMFIRFLLDYCKKKSLELCAKNIQTKEDKEWMESNGIKYLEGNYIQNPKKLVKAALGIE